MDLCLDVLGVILEFTDDIKTIHNFFLLNTDVNRYMVENIARICENVVLEVKYIKRKPPKWVRGLSILKHKRGFISDLIYIRKGHLKTLILDDEIVDKDLHLIRGIKNVVIKSGQFITDDGFKNLKGIHTLKLDDRCCNITERGLEHISGVSSLSINCNRIEDFFYLKGISEFVGYDSHRIKGDNMEDISGIKHLELSNDHISDYYLVYLRGIKVLQLLGNTKITDDGLKYLSGIKELSLPSNNNISDKGLSNLKGIKTFINLKSYGITDKGLSYLRGIKYLHLGCSSKNITNNGLSYLKEISYLTLEEHNELITDDGLSNLSGIQHLHISSRKITDKGLSYLKGIKVFKNRKMCKNITDVGLSYLSGAKIQMIDMDGNVSEINPD